MGKYLEMTSSLVLLVRRSPIQTRDTIKECLYRMIRARNLTREECREWAEWLRKNDK